MKAGRELDALVAEKVFGMHRHPGCDLDDHLRAECYGTGTEEGYGPVVDYSTDSAAAWQVVEKLTELHVVSVSCMLNKRWRCEVVQAHSQRQTPVNAIADTAPLAICLAALKAVGVEMEE